MLVACLVWQAAGAILSEDWLLLATVILRTWEEAVFAPKWKMCIHSVVAKVSLCGFVMLFCSANSYSTLNSLTLFWLAESVQWIFENSARDVIAADYTITMSMTLKVTVSHVKFASRQWWSKNMTSIFFVQCIIKLSLDSVFGISRIIKVLVSRRLRLLTLTETLITLDITKTLSNKCLLSDVLHRYSVIYFYNHLYRFAYPESSSGLWIHHILWIISENYWY